MQVEPELEARRRTGRRFIAVSAGVGCLGFIMLFAFLAIWQFLSPGREPSRRRTLRDGGVPRRYAPPVSSP